MLNKHPSFESIELVPVIPIPIHLTGEIKSKLAYVDEWIEDVEVSQEKIVLYRCFSASLNRLSIAPRLKRKYSV